MEIVKFAYNEQEIEFELGKSNLMVNATEMAKIFGKDLFQFTKSENTKSFIKSCLKPAFAGLLHIKNEKDLVISKQKSGTWMHRILALKFAAWLDSDFELWIFITIDNLINKNFRDERELLIEKLSLKKRIELRKQELLKEFAYSPKIIELLKLNDLFKKNDKKLKITKRKQVKQLAFEL
jgi:hypothetical protein